MRPEAAATEAGECPFLVPVMADRLWLHPVGTYCRRPDGRVRVPSSRTTLPLICLTAAHFLCPGYMVSVAHDRRT